MGVGFDNSQNCRKCKHACEMLKDNWLSKAADIIDIMVDTLRNGFTRNILQPHLHFSKASYSDPSVYY